LKVRSMFDRILHESYVGKWVVTGLLIGIVAGLGAIVFYALIQLVTNVLLGGITGFYPPTAAGELSTSVISHPNFLLIPVSTVIGGLIAGLLVFKFAPEAEGHGTDAAIESFHQKNGKIRKRVPIIKTIASAFTIGSGGSAGREGPTALISAGFGSAISDALKLSASDRRTAVAVGIGAGIGSIFKSPFAGAILSAEILYSGGDFEVSALIPAFIASPVGYVIFGSYAGFTPIFGTSSSAFSFSNPWSIIIFAILGLLCGLIGRFYTTTFYSVKSYFNSVRLPNYFKPAIGAAFAGIIGIFFPQVIGLGYGFLQFLIDGKLNMITTNYIALPLIITLSLIVLLKIFATSLTIGSGGSGGVFAPALGIGGFIGAALWVATNSLFPGFIPLAGSMVIVGMMALFAGVGRVPIAVILMVSEMTGNLSLIAPSMVAVVIAFFVCGSKYTIYRSQVKTRADSPAHRGEYNVPLLTKIQVMDATNPHCISLAPNDTVKTAYQLMLEKHFNGLPILDSQKVVGIVALSDIMRVPREQMGSTQLADIMTKNVIVTYPDESLHDVLHKMTTNGIGRMPVVSRQTGQLLGIVTRTDVMKAYDKVAETLSEAKTTTQ
jgi:CIC family chloride channel protein